MNKALNPRIEIQNLEGHQWQVRLVHDFGNGEQLDVTVQLPKQPDLRMGALEAAVVSRAQEVLQLLR